MRKRERKEGILTCPGRHWEETASSLHREKKNDRRRKRQGASSLGSRAVHHGASVKKDSFILWERKEKENAMTSTSVREKGVSAFTVQEGREMAFLFRGGGGEGQEIEGRRGKVFRLERSLSMTRKGGGETTAREGKRREGSVSFLTRPGKSLLPHFFIRWGGRNANQKKLHSQGGEGER